MPLNLTGFAAPVQEIRYEIRTRLSARGVRLLDEGTHESFMAKHRVRYVGGLSANLASAFAEETAVAAVLVTSIEQYDEAYPSKVALTSRLVSTGVDPRPLWMDGSAFVGDQSPGFLSLGLVDEAFVVRARVVDDLVESLVRYLEGRGRGKSEKRRKFRPRSIYRHDELVEERDLPRIAVLPFSNESGRRHAGEIVALQLVRHLAGRPNVRIVEPGEVRDALLRTRMIMEGGPSLSQADLLRDLLNVDLVLTGTVSDYIDKRSVDGFPRAVLSVRAINTWTRQIVWASTSYNRGNGGVFFFDVGMIHSAQELASEMARQTVVRMLK